MEAFTYIKDIGHKDMAGGLSWLLVMGYVLTISVYAFTFGHYLSYVLNIENLIFSRAFAIGIILIFVGINLKGTGGATWIEIITVWGKLIILLGIAWMGLNQLNLDSFMSWIEGYHSEPKKYLLKDYSKQFRNLADIMNLCSKINLFYYEIAENIIADIKKDPKLVA